MYDCGYTIHLSITQGGKILLFYKGAKEKNFDFGEIAGQKSVSAIEELALTPNFKSQVSYNHPGFYL